MEPCESAEIVQNPLLNIHIVERVFSNLSLKSLFKCRLVCHIWEFEAVRALKKLQVAASVKGESSLQEFQSCVESSNGHPYQSYCIELNKSSFAEKVELCASLLQQICEDAKSLKFMYELPTGFSEQSGPESFEDNIITLPELSSLHLFSVNIFPPEPSCQLPKLFNRLHAPNLEGLCVQHLYNADCASTITRFIQESQKGIRSLRIPCVEFPKIFQESVDLTRLRELDICDLFHGSFATMEALSCIQRYCPNLESLAVEIGIRVTFSGVHAMLEKLSGSLVTLKLMIQDKNLLSRQVQAVHFHIPFLPKLRSLFLRYTNPGLIYHIENLPSLEVLELETPWTRKIRGRIFPPGNGPYSSLKTVNLSEKLTEEDVISLSTFFPSISTLCASFQNNAAFLQLPRLLPNLDTLIVDRNSHVTEDCMCGTLGQIGDLQSAPDSPPLWNMQKLKTLKLLQVGLTSRTLTLGLQNLRNLEVLETQATTLKIGSQAVHENPAVVESLHSNHPKLRRLSIWIRRSSERLSPQDVYFLSQRFPHWQLQFTIQAVCSLI